MAVAPPEPRSILITGGSSGLGAALARSYAAPGVALALTGRDEARLSEVAHLCREAGAEVESASLSVTDGPALRDWITGFDGRHPLDLVVANAGRSAGTGGDGEGEQQTRDIFEVNLTGVLNTVLPALEGMRARGRGQVAIMASLAAFRGFPGAPAYCASKAAVRVWGESLRSHLAAEGIAVSVICPGFVKTRMTAVNRFPMPLLMEADAAAQVIRRGLARNRARIAFPWPLASLVWLIAALPPGLVDSLLARLPRKD